VRGEHVSISERKKKLKPLGLPWEGKEKEGNYGGS